MDKAKLLNHLRTSHAALEQILAALSDQQKTRPGVEGDWSVKDVIAHLTFWQQWVIDRLAEGAPGRPAAPLDVDALNAAIYARSRDRSLADVLAGWRRSHRDLLAQVEALSQSELTDPARYVWTGGRPVWEEIAEESYGHARDHMAALRAWVKQEQG